MSIVLLVHARNKWLDIESMLERVFYMVGMQPPLLHFLNCIVGEYNSAKGGVCFCLGHAVVL